ncbi:MAG: hypothetical protein DKM50_09960 [Candidatus Margulisiibacteriota bacterium]|nr:MAG: hypothetical protein A2X42_02555 [Candidatus Margulisbacteria bacterium GWF2_38_17]OGI06221.1 MAG: hypothetical protein A2X41_08135 [Candidatus Margulisbacteria bacterium GWE2_39_32]PZM78877.1 MAG: hypothetical protein DKM50_09960 [Candidatus Margulisiibacteriota bacterium]HCT84580.1 hypothetical protein [Candidatus Margulisiibacteriota bacterium]HCY37094.1 hypothetical protein [Candidatus Margulisiibacteriota bacterium]
MYEISNYRNWENSYTLYNDTLKIVVVPQIGGRVYSIAYNGKEFCRQNKLSEGKIASPDDNSWLNWGGDFDWVGPQESWNMAGWPPPFELDSGAWNVLSYSEQSISLQSKPCSLGVRIKKKISLSGSRVTVKRELENTSDRPVIYGLWNITQVSTEGLIIIPLRDPKYSTIKVFESQAFDQWEDLLKNKIIETDYSSDTINIRINEKKGSFKIGVVSDVGRIDYTFNDFVMSKIISPSHGVQYPHGCNIEIYRDEKSGYTELEQLWESKELAPGDICYSEQEISFENK